MRFSPALLATLAAIPVLLASSAISGVAAATLKPFSTLAGSTVRLSDLWEGLEPGMDKELGPAPPPGGRITVEAPQLAAIARQFGVDWHPGSGPQQAVLSREGRPMTREAVTALLVPALAAAGAPADAELDLPAFNPPMLTADPGVRAEVTQLDFDVATGRFSAVLSVLTNDAEPVRTRVAGSVQAMATALVLTRRVALGAVIDAADVQVSRLRATLLHGEPATLPVQASGMALRRPLLPGQPIMLSDLVRPPAVTRGAFVAVQLEGHGILLTAQAQVLDNGAPGDRVRVINPDSRAVLLAQVDGPGRVHVLPGSQPLVQAAGYGRPGSSFSEPLPR